MASPSKTKHFNNLTIPDNLQRTEIDITKINLEANIFLIDTLSMDQQYIFHLPSYVDRDFERVSNICDGEWVPYIYLKKEHPSKRFQTVNLEVQKAFLV